MSHEPGPDWAALSEALLRRRGLLRLAQSDLLDRGGPGEATVRRIERREVTGIRATTKTQLERAVGWAPGVVDKLLSGRATREEVDGPGVAWPEPPAHIPGLLMSEADGRTFHLRHQLDAALMKQDLRSGDRAFVLAAELVQVLHNRPEPEAYAAKAALLDYLRVLAPREHGDGDA